MKSNVVPLSPAQRKTKRQRARRGERKALVPLRLEDLADLVTVEETARYFRVSPDKIYEVVHSGQIAPIVRFGQVIRIPRGTLARIVGADLASEDADAS